MASREPGSQFVHQLEARDPGPSQRLETLQAREAKAQREREAAELQLEEALD